MAGVTGSSPVAPIGERAEPAYTESTYSTVMSGNSVVRATETSFGIDLSRDGPPPDG